MDMLTNYDYTFDYTSDGDGAAETWGAEAGYGIISASKMLAWVEANCDACSATPTTVPDTLAPIIPGTPVQDSSGTLAPTTSGDTCSNGVEGIEAQGVCCSIECNLCAGTGCSSRPGGPDSCCSLAIKEAGVFCSDSAAPCIIGSTSPSVCS
ncbi:unnamed protein product, partial [Pylaiella littoralis]